jgi:hypothetical protein
MSPGAFHLLEIARRLSFTVGLPYSLKEDGFEDIYYGWGRIVKGSNRCTS